MFSISLEGSITKLLNEQVGLEVLWDQQGDSYLFSVLGENGAYTLYYRSSRTGPIQQLPLATKASHCAWGADRKTIYCGVAQQDANSTTLEGLYRLNTSTDTPELLLSNTEGEFPMSIEYIFSAEAGKYLIILNAFDNRLYGLKI